MARVEGTVVMTSMEERREELTNSYLPVPLKRFPKRVLSETSEEKYWRGFKKKTEFPAMFKSKVSCIDFNLKHPFSCVITGQGKVQIFHPQTHDKTKEWHPPDTMYCTRWRGDGKMLVSAGEKPSIKVWTLGNMKLIRELKPDLERGTGHTRAVHSVGFLPDNRRVLSGSDDTTAIVWDVATQQQEVRLTGHKDYVRSCCPHPYNTNVVATSGCDGVVKVWDLRASCDAAVQEFRVTDAVRTVLFHPTGKYLAVASATDVTLWDSAMAGQDEGEQVPMALLSNHTKDITSLQFNHHGSRLFTASVDRHVKVYETENFTAVHTMTYSEPVFAVGISPDNSCFAAGTLEGKIYLKSRPASDQADRDSEGEDEAEAEHQEINVFSGLGDVRAAPKRNWKVPRKGEEVDDEFIVESVRERRLKKYDVQFRKFNYHGALDAVLAEKVSNLDRYNRLFTVLTELQRRNGLRIALSGRDAGDLVQLLLSIKECILEPRFCDLMTLTLNLVLEIYHSVIHESPEILMHVSRIRRKVTEQVSFLSSLQEVSGTIAALSHQSKLQRMKRERLAAASPN
ncbi:U3 small nucleolar RNA-associated protein 15 [Diplonema papillatum]|nr:U3 small nucleolar RNA-associated protein 15 [Diplonema papillatum]KAJ9471556.1 U3 small nucleolar RNA-associated protein 15 [Diplonema papillatum]|eukprot:gene8114-12481_t